MGCSKEMNWGCWKGCHLVQSSDCLKEKNSGMSSDFQKVHHLEQNWGCLKDRHLVKNWDYPREKSWDRMMAHHWVKR